MKNRERNMIWILGGGLLLVLAMPYIILGQAVYFPTLGTTNQTFISLHLLKLNNLLLHWSPEKEIPHVFTGLENSYLLPYFNFQRILFFILPSFHAYVVNFLVVRMIGFVGMCLLLREYLSKEGSLSYFFPAVAFSLLTPSALEGLGVFGQPLLLWSFLNLSNAKYSSINWVIIIGFPFFSNLFPSGVFIILALTFLGVIKLLRSQEVGTQYFPGIFFLAILYVLSHYPLGYRLYMNEGTSYLGTLDFWQEGFLPLLWLVGSLGLFIGLFNLMKNLRIPSYLKTVCWVMTIGFIIGLNTEIRENSMRTLGLESKEPSFQEFWAPPLLQELKAYIARPLDTYKAVTLGINPAVLTYNGIHTLGADIRNYPLDYRKSMSSILIENDALADSSLSINCCFLSPEILRQGCQINCYNYLGNAIDDLSIDTSKLKELGVSYLVSSVPIRNLEEGKMRFEKKFNREDAYWDLYLYTLNP